MEDAAFRKPGISPTSVEKSVRVSVASPPLILFHLFIKGKHQFTTLLENNNITLID